MFEFITTGHTRSLILTATIATAISARSFENSQITQAIKQDRHRHRFLSHLSGDDNESNNVDQSVAQSHTCHFGLDRIKKGVGLDEYLDILNGDEQFVDETFPLVDAIRWDDMPEHVSNDLSKEE